MKDFLVTILAYLVFIVVRTTAVHVSVPCCADFVQTDAAFGPSLPQDEPGIVGDIVYLKDNGCSDSSFRGINGNKKVLMIERGSCSFAKKVYNAQAHGASAVIIYDNIYENLLTMASYDKYVSAIRIPSVFITKEAANYIKDHHSQVVFLSRKDSLSFSPPYFVLSWMFAVSLTFVLSIGVGVLINRLCCCCPHHHYIINSGAYEPSESATYVEFVEAEMEDEEDEEKHLVNDNKDGIHEDDEDDDDCDDDRISVRFSKGDGLSEPFLVSV